MLQNNSISYSNLLVSQVWNRYTLSDGEQHYSRTHIAASRVSQPVYFGGLSVPDTDSILLIKVLMVEKDVQNT